MERKTKLFIAKSAVVLSVIPILIYAYETGPDAGKSGVPGESVCAEAGCHVGTVNSGPGSVSVEFPGAMTYTPGAKQHLKVTVSDPNQRRWGFQLTARAANDPKAQAGSFTPASDGFTQVVCASANLSQQGSNCGSSMPLAYIEHTISGTRLGQTGSATFEFDWTPPASDIGPVIIYVAGNAANGDRNNTGDRIYTKSYTLQPAATGGGSGDKPTISASSGVVNGASFQPGIAQGSWVTIAGTNLAGTTRTWRADEITAGKLPTSLDGVSVTINNKPAAVYFISPTQINVQAPSDDSTGPVPVVVTSNGTQSDASTAQLQQYAPAFFLWSGKYAVATRQDGSLAVAPDTFPGLSTTAAKPGDVLVLWGTGFGATNPAMAAGQTVPADRIYSVAGDVKIRLDGAPVQVFGAALSPGFAGLYQVAIQVPAGAPDGDLKIEGEVGGVALPANVFLTIKK